jgi:hypothetical protein
MLPVSARPRTTHGRFCINEESFRADERLVAQLRDSARNIGSAYQHASVGFYAAGKIFASCYLFNGRTIFPEHFELVPIVTSKMIIQRFLADDALYSLIPVESPENNNIAVGGSEKRGHFGRIVALLPLAATTSGISSRSGPDDSLLYFSLQRSLRTVKPPAR